MNDESLGALEERLVEMASCRLEESLRDSILAEVNRELRAARWDARWSRVAVSLLIVGMGLNLSLGWHASNGAPNAAQLVHTPPPRSLVETALAVAEVTDARTGSQYARQLAVMMGHPLTAQDMAAIDEALHGLAPQVTNGSKG